MFTTKIIATEPHKNATLRSGVKEMSALSTALLSKKLAYTDTQPSLSHNIILKTNEMKLIKYYECLQTKAPFQCKAL